MADEMQKAAAKAAGGDGAQDLLRLEKAEAQALLERLPKLGPILSLYMQSSPHKNIFVSDFEWRVVPAIVLDQYKLYMQGSAPLAFVSWAFVGEEEDRQLRNGKLRLAPKDWKSGDRVWVIDVVAPFGSAKELLRGLLDEVFAGRTVMQLVPRRDGTGMDPVEWKGLIKK